MKKATILIVLVALLSLGGSRCSSGDSDAVYEEGSKLLLKPHWTADTRVSYYHGGGMRDESENIEITKDSVIYRIREEGVENKIRLKLSIDQLDLIAKAFYEADFTQITEKDIGTVYDAASTSLSICIGPNCCNKACQISSQFSKLDGERFFAVRGKVLDIVAKELQKNKVTITVDVDPKLITDLKRKLHFQIAPGNIYFNEKSRVEHDEYSVNPGNYRITAYTYIKKEQGRIYYSPMLEESFHTKDVSGLRIGLKDTILTIEKIMR